MTTPKKASLLFALYKKIAPQSARSYLVALHAARHVNQKLGLQAYALPSLFGKATVNFGQAAFTVIGEKNASWNGMTRYRCQKGQLTGWLPMLFPLRQDLILRTSDLLYGYGQTIHESIGGLSAKDVLRLTVEVADFCARRGYAKRIDGASYRQPSDWEARQTILGHPSQPEAANWPRVGFSG